MVYDAVKKRSVPVTVVLAGGYTNRLEDTVAIHTATIEELIQAAPF